MNRPPEEIHLRSGKRSRVFYDGLFRKSGTIQPPCRAHQQTAGQFRHAGCAQPRCFVRRQAIHAPLPMADVTHVPMCGASQNPPLRLSSTATEHSGTGPWSMRPIALSKRPKKQGWAWDSPVISVITVLRATTPVCAWKPDASGSRSRAYRNMGNARGQDPKPQIGLHRQSAALFRHSIGRRASRGAGRSYSNPG